MDCNHLFSLKGRVVVITGGAGLLGQQHALAVRRAGGEAVLLDVSETALQSAKQTLQEQGEGGISILKVDITVEEEVRKASEAIIQQYGNVYGLVNNAAINPKMEKSDSKEFSRLENFPVEQWQMELDVGLKGAFLCTRYFGTAMAESGTGGAIVNICSDLGVIAPDQRLYEQPGLPPAQQPVKPVTYSVIKSGLIGLSRYVATYWAEQNVRCNALCPGGIENGQPEAFLQKIVTRIPLGRMAQKEEYQGTLIWMLSDASSYLNGAVVNVDGGRTTW